MGSGTRKDLGDSPGRAAPSQAVGSRCSRPRGAGESGCWRHGPRTWLGGRGRPWPPVSRSLNPSGVSAAGGREDEGSERADRQATWFAAGPRGPRVGALGVGSRPGLGWVGRAHPGPLSACASARGDSSPTDFCGPNCPKQGSVRSEPIYAAGGEDESKQ